MAHWLLLIQLRNMNFDETEKAAAKNVCCSNHISFCSKFLHFYFPLSVFIIDSYAFDGSDDTYSSCRVRRGNELCEDV